MSQNRPQLKILVVSIICLIGLRTFEAHSKGKPPVSTKITPDQSKAIDECALKAGFPPKDQPGFNFGSTTAEQRKKMAECMSEKGVALDPAAAGHRIQPPHGAEPSLPPRPTK
ncbi:MAG: hypothetical protein V4736_05470 [Bdellovibrionota bacterium]